MSARPDGFMPLYIGDYLADTSHLSTAEHGAYLLLLMHYWRTGTALADDDAALARIARATKAEWKAARNAVRAFFKPATIDGAPVLVHGRVEREMVIAKEKYEAKRRASAAANEKRWGSQKPSEPISQNDPSAIPNGSFCDPQSQSHCSKEQIYPLAKARSKRAKGLLNGHLTDFEAFYAAYPKHEARGAAEKAYLKALEIATPEQLLAGARSYAASRAGEDRKFTKQPATWLNQKCWLDEAASKGPPNPAFDFAARFAALEAKK